MFVSRKAKVISIMVLIVIILLSILPAIIGYVNNSIVTSSQTFFNVVSMVAVLVFGMLLRWVTLTGFLLIIGFIIVTPIMKFVFGEEEKKPKDWINYVGFIALVIIVGYQFIFSWNLDSGTIGAMFEFIFPPLSH